MLHRDNSCFTAIKFTAIQLSTPFRTVHEIAVEMLENVVLAAG